MSQSDNGNRKRNPSGGGPPQRRGQRPQGDAPARNANWRELLPEGAETNAEGGRRGPSQGERRGGPQRGGPQRGGPQRGGQPRDGQRRGPQAPPEPSLEYVLVQPDHALAAEISSHPGPLRWRPIPDISLLSSGLYLRYRGSLQLVARELLFPDAVLYTVWDDENLQYRFSDGWASPGLRAAFLVRTPYADNEGPPWIPIDAAIPDSIEEWDRGLLSSHLDPVHCTLFRAKLIADHSGLQVSADAIREDGREKADQALQETMAWLARHPESDHPAAVTARVMLVEQGHGLQRAGISAMSKSDESTTALLRDVLTVLAPDVAPVLQAVQALWLAGDDEQVEHFVELARALQPHVESERSPLQQPKNLAVLITWLTGIFGSRPDRERRRPARSLFAALRLLRRLHGDLDALDHPDVDLPTFPTSRELSDEITRELSYYPQGETDLERLVRAMAVGESSRDFGRVNLDHLRPFSVSYHRVRGFPVATRTLLGRYDGIVTMWSFRGRDLEDNELPARILEANLVLDTTTWASTRAYGRVLGYRGPVAAAFAEALAMTPERGASHHPDTVRLAELHGMEPADIADRLARATRARRPNSGRVSDAIAAHEYMIALLGKDAEALPEWAPIEPEWAGGDDCAVRRHFMYWRAYCRSFLPASVDAYGTFLQRAVPALADLPWKLENEALALLRIWSRHVDAEQIEGFLPALEARLEAILAENDQAARDERVLNILSVLGGISWDAWEDGIRQLLEHPQWADAEWHRILEATRHGATGEALLSSELFKELGTRLASVSTVGSASGRVEWVRQLLGRGRGAQHVRWLLHRESWPEVVFSTAFDQWFQDHALAAIDAPDAAVVQLLELAAGLMSPETVDIAMYHLGERSEHDTATKLNVLLKAGRGLSAAAWLVTVPNFTAEHVNAVLALGLAEARSAQELRILAQLVFVAKARGLQLDTQQLDELTARVRRHQLPDSDRIVLGYFLDAWRLLNMELSSEEAAIALRQAGLCFSETNDVGCRRFLTWAVDQALVQEVGDDILAALHNADSLELLLGALDALEWPEAIKRGLTTLVRMPRRSQQHRALWNALRNGQESFALESLLDAEILRRAESNVEELVNGLSALEARLGELSAEPTAEESAAQEQADVDESVDEVSDESAREETSSGEDAAPRGERQTAAERFGDYLNEHVRAGFVKRLRAAIRFWKQELRGVDEATVAALGAPIKQALGQHQVLAFGLRDAVYPRVIERAKLLDLPVGDPRNVIANSLLKFGVDASPVALDAIIDNALSVFGADGGERKTQISRDALVIFQATPKTAADTVLAEAETELAPDNSADNALDAASEEQDAASAEAAESADAESSTDASQDSAIEEKESASPLVQAWSGRKLEEDLASEGLPSRLLVASIQRVLKRNDMLSFRVSGQDRGDEVIVRWSRPRRFGRRG